MANNPLLNSSLLSLADLQDAEQKLTDVETVLHGKVPELTAEQRRNLGSVDEQNKLLISKVISGLDSHPHIQPTGIDWVAFQQEALLREQLEVQISRTKSILYKLESAKILHDHSNMQDSLGYYRFLDYLNTTKQTDVTVLHNDFKTHFKKYGTGAIRAARRRAAALAAQNTKKEEE